ncbi:S-layer homology domain-containing protein [Pseudobacteroides cellulosolvens]|uniref:S-layer domain-containing protein n=1 Tax=Pseudobacteroides cellulosolvens ATCC 35603 = DSM 2933 TaxID=398512 RepID=A0A0L6JU49_9FIRM|nr:S-layer homology domain-containing protein [Pseudobacteroides cellulosolvens]KNY29234.1 S-layer domain-containing protein [Pseudobacteroides cellulosolvens ATCC 35603 = DSM 2933]
MFATQFDRGDFTISSFDMWSKTRYLTSMDTIVTGTATGWQPNWHYSPLGHAKKIQITFTAGDPTMQLAVVLMDGYVTNGRVVPTGSSAKYYTVQSGQALEVINSSNSGMVFLSPLYAPANTEQKSGQYITSNWRVDTQVLELQAPPTPIATNTPTTAPTATPTLAPTNTATPTNTPIPVPEWTGEFRTQDPNTPAPAPEWIGEVIDGVYYPSANYTTAKFPNHVIFTYNGTGEFGVPATDVNPNAFTGMDAIGAVMKFDYNTNGNCYGVTFKFPIDNKDIADNVICYLNDNNQWTKLNTVVETFNNKLYAVATLPTNLISPYMLSVSKSFTSGVFKNSTVPTPVSTPVPTPTTAPVVPVVPVAPIVPIALPPVIEAPVVALSPTPTNTPVNTPVNTPTTVATSTPVSTPTNVPTSTPTATPTIVAVNISANTQPVKVELKQIINTNTLPENNTKTVENIQKTIQTVTTTDIQKATEKLPDIKQHWGQDITREQMTAIIVRAITLKNKTAIEMNKPITITDYQKIDSQYKDSIVYAYMLGITSGMGNGTFAPKSTATRAQASVLIVKLIDKLR